MNSSPKYATQLAVIALSAALWLPSARAQTATPPSKATTSSSPSMSSMGGMDMKSMMKQNDDKMSAMAVTGKPDVDFAMRMKIHHQGAIDMAQAELRDGQDPQMRKMATAIIAAQKNEIAQFDAFLAKNKNDMPGMKK